jgi:tagatose 6-phosphate kinase
VFDPRAAAQMSYILCIGLNPALQKVYTFDRIAHNGVNRAKTAHALASGKGINVARTLTLLGHPSVTTGFLGGPNGQTIESELKREGIHSAFTTITNDTRQCITLIDKGRNVTTELIEPSPQVTSLELDHWIHAYESLVPWSKLVVLSGTAPTGVPAITYRRLINYARKQGKQIHVDCGGELWRECTLAEPDVLKCNEEEFLSAQNMKSAVFEKLAAISSHCIRGNTSWIVITRGPDAAIFATKEGVFSASPPKIEAINPIGSGDAVSAGLACSIQENKSIDEVIRFSMACGAANALISGPGVVRPQDVKRLCDDVKIKRIKIK